MKSPAILCLIVSYVNCFEDPTCPPPKDGPSVLNAETKIVGYLNKDANFTTEIFSAKSITLSDIEVTRHGNLVIGNELSWHDKYELEIVPLPGNRSCHSTNYGIKFRIKNLTYEDIGYYEFKPDLVDIIIEVMGPPKIENFSRVKFVKPNATITLWCKVPAYELYIATLEWWWYTCSKNNCSSAKGTLVYKDKYSGQSSDVFHKNTNEGYLLVVLYTVKESGYLECSYTTTNFSTQVVPYDRFYSSVYISVFNPKDGHIVGNTNLENGFALLLNRMPPYLYEDQELEFKCIASEDICETPALTIKFNGQTSLESVQNAIVSWSIIDTRPNELLCILKCESEPEETILYSFFGLQRQEIKLISSNLNGDSVSRNLLSEVDLYCDVISKPYPVIKWFRDNIELTHGGHIKISNGGKNLTVGRLTIADSGNYTCLADNEFGSVSKSMLLDVKKEKKSIANDPVLITSFSILGIIAMILVAIAVIYGKKLRDLRNARKEFVLLSQYLNDSTNQSMVNKEIPMDEQVEFLSYDIHRWEVKKEDIVFGQVLGQGNFGRVVEAQLRNGSKSMRVAVKMLKDTTDIQQFKSLIGELKIMSNIGSHRNILNLIAACTSKLSVGELYVIVEHCALGCLKDFLVKSRKKFVNLLADSDEYVYQNYDYAQMIPDDGLPMITSNELLSFCFQISSGMSYLASQSVRIL